MDDAADTTRGPEGDEAFGVTDQFLIDEDDPEEDGVSLEELTRTYARLLVPDEAVSTGAGDSGQIGDDAQELGDMNDAHELDGILNGTELGALGLDDSPARDDATELDDPPALDDPIALDDACPVTPTSIIESILMVGRPDGGPISAAEIARLMRGVDEEEVVELIAEINQLYAQSDRAFRIVASGTGYRMQLTDDLSFLVDMFYGRARPIRLNQPAIDILALVAYQPGISRETLEEQRGQNSSSLLNQLVRRQLLEMRREGEAGRTACYYPTERLLELVGLNSLEDLPQAEDWE